MNKKAGTIIELATLISAVVACCIMSYSLLMSVLAGSYQAAAKKIAISENIPRAMGFRVLSGIPLPLERGLGEEDTDLKKSAVRGDDRVYYPGRTIGSTRRETRINEAAAKAGSRHGSLKSIRRGTRLGEDTLGGR